MADKNTPALPDPNNGSSSRALGPAGSGTVGPASSSSPENTSPNAVGPASGFNGPAARMAALNAQFQAVQGAPASLGTAAPPPSASHHSSGQAAAPTPAGAPAPAHPPSPAVNPPTPTPPPPGLSPEEAAAVRKKVARKEGLITWGLRGLYAAGFAALGYFKGPAVEAVITNPNVDIHTGQTQHQKDIAKREYGDITPERRAELKRQMEEANARLSEGQPLASRSPADKAARQLNQGFAQTAAEPAGRNILSADERNVLGGLLLGGAITGFLRWRSGRGTGGPFGPQARGIAGRIYGNDPAEKAYNYQIKQEEGPTDAARGQQVPPHFFPDIANLLSGHGSQVEFSPGRTDRLQPKPGETRAEQNRGAYPPPQAKGPKPS